MRLLTLNCNGLRAATRKGLLDWLPDQQVDVLCLQETRIQDFQLTDAMKAPGGLECVFHHAEKPGYSGVALGFRRPPDRLQVGIGWPEFDAEGRFLQADWGNLSVISLYLPSGTSSEARQAFKYKTMEYLEQWMEAFRESGREAILCGDWNIAHQEIDLKNWKGNQKNSGFLPEEREWLTKLFSRKGWVDVFRRLNPNPDHYTWWSNRGQAWAKNVGWRIDYQVATPGVAETAQAERIHREPRFSDHAPLIIDYDWDLGLR
ncbi:MAG: exodeoxyribonuclease III [bacterium]|jgi:exodeoxyribonuclease-3